MPRLATSLVLLFALALSTSQAQYGSPGSESTNATHAGSLGTPTVVGGANNATSAESTLAKNTTRAGSHGADSAIGASKNATTKPPTSAAMTTAVSTAAAVTISATAAVAGFTVL